MKPSNVKQAAKSCPRCHGQGSIANGSKLLTCPTCGGYGVVRR